ncbi:hypothetical protein Tc00.1047053508161.23 [Trypanosoma cruzi]|uniref:Uncharacterized protein n=1 Tax=Trypanosoma cruzi (strain CL Brener) TaxID=353153 RepID=Q4D477_TRYCC|nr:hypothetical protein Tc00.1047053508161.23 [Trypanosoma cruzi]EAN87331.1 hypothetical protein Tc00.1047053508161.23 [Trypanosoma cruzi]|eukprot:XP_809182.1 hypothetical protein [Trypanosoma cruzi strain CL Brener]
MKYKRCADTWRVRRLKHTQPSFQFSFPAKYIQTVRCGDTAARRFLNLCGTVMDDIFFICNYFVRWVYIRRRGTFFFLFVLNKSCVDYRLLGCCAVMSLSGLLVVASAMRLCCTFLCVSPHTLLPLFYFFALCFCRHTQPHAQDAHCSGFECSFCSACWQLRVAAAFFFRGHEEKGGGEGVRSPSLFSCGCGAPCVAALSWAPCPIEGGMAGNFFAASWMDEGLLARVCCVVGARSVCVVWWPRVFAISLGL